VSYGSGDCAQQRDRTTGRMSMFEVAGYLASGLVFAAFCMKDMVRLRLAALASNLAFIAYGIGLDLLPIFLLHAVLLPVNALRLWQAARPYGAAHGSDVHHAARSPSPIAGGRALTTNVNCIYRSPTYRSTVPGEGTETISRGRSPLHSAARRGKARTRANIDPQ
jgi:hypothetical protein